MLKKIIHCLIPKLKTDPNVIAFRRKVSANMTNNWNIIYQKQWMIRDIILSHEQILLSLLNIDFSFK